MPPALALIGAAASIGGGMAAVGGTMAGFLGAGLGAAGQAGGFGMLFGSSEKTKHMGGKVEGASDAVESSGAKHWKYRKGLGDGSQKPRMGPTAESLRDATGGVVSDGEKVDGIAMLGLHHAAIGEQGNRLKRIEKKLGLSDAQMRKAA